MSEMTSYTMICRTGIALMLIFIFKASANLEVVPGEKFENIVKETKYVLALFVNDVETCTHCKQFENEVEKVVNPELYIAEIRKVKCEDSSVAEKYGASAVPHILFFRDGVPALFASPDNSADLKVEDIQVWLEQAQEVATQTLNDETFEHLTQAATGATTGDWLVIFYCPKCEHYLPVIEGAGVKIKHQMNVAKVNIEENPGLKARFKIKDCPSTYFFRQGKMYHYFSEEPDQYQVKSLLSFVLYWYKNVKAEPVRVEQTGFDKLTEYIAEALKEQMSGPNRGVILILAGLLIGLVSLVIILSLILKKPKETKKD